MTAQPAAPTMHPVAATINKIKVELKKQFRERDDVIDAIWLAVLSNRHLFILGPPGTAKSFLIRESIARIGSMRYFETILSKTRPAEAVLGPFDIPELRDKGNLVRRYAGYLPDVDFAMLDEVGKMPATLGHDLLAVVLERRLHQVDPATGQSWVDVPLRSFFGGSNELPTNESDDAAALWDRLDLRVVVEDIQETGNWVDLMSQGADRSASATTIDFSDLADAADNVVPKVTIPHDVVEVMAKLREELRAMEIDPSTRRWMQTRAIMRASAFLDGRTEVTVDDIAVLRHMLWEDPTQIRAVERKTLSVSNPMAEEVLNLSEKVAEIRAEIQKMDPELAMDKRAALASQLAGNLKKLSREVGTLQQKAISTNHSTAAITKVAADLQKLQVDIYAEVLGAPIPTF